ncbi:hypothetical protein B7463_g9726, partial [Scytalidium lignicola]
MTSAAAKLPTRQLGRGGPQVTTLGYGAMGLRTSYGPAGTDEERFVILDAAYDRGLLFWDTADVYGDNEDLLGKWFKLTGKRDEIFLASKFGAGVLPNGEVFIRSDPEYVFEACEKSLKRLGVDCIDLYYHHRLDMKTPIEKTVAAMVELKKQGKIKYLGLSEISADTLRRAHTVHPITAIQVEYSPFSMDIENPQIGLLKLAKELGVAVIAYSPLGRGMLTGLYRSPDDFPEDDIRRIMPRFSKENFAKNFELVEKIAAFAKQKGCTPGQLTLAWIFRQWDMIFPIPGTKKIKYLEENIGALDVKLIDEEDTKIRDAIEAAEVIGGRYSDIFSSNLLADTPPLE